MPTGELCRAPLERRFALKAGTELRHLALGIFETSERVQELEQPVIGLESFCPLAVMRFELGKRGLLELEMSMEIGLGRLDRLMAEPRRDH